MDGQRFDRLAKALAAGSSRRSVLKGLLGLSGAAAAGSALAPDAEARTTGSRPSPSILHTPTTTTTQAPVPTTPPPDPCAGFTTTCSRDGCCNGACTADGRCCPTGMTICGEDCCASPDQCCGGECCPQGTICIAEELCCPPAVFCGGVCCNGAGQQCCGDVCLQAGQCCIDDQCPDSPTTCQLGVCNPATNTCELTAACAGSPGTTCCSGACVVLGTLQNCLSCGNSCGSGQACCSGGCTTLGTLTNCAACGDACDLGESCTGAGCLTTTTTAAPTTPPPVTTAVPTTAPPTTTTPVPQGTTTTAALGTTTTGTPATTTTAVPSTTTTGAPGTTTTEAPVTTTTGEPGTTTTAGPTSTTTTGAPCVPACSTGLVCCNGICQECCGTDGSTCSDNRCEIFSCSDGQCSDNPIASVICLPPVFPDCFGAGMCNPDTGQCDRPYLGDDTSCGPPTQGNGSICCNQQCIPENESNCGTCGNTCDAGETCTAGVCVTMTTTTTASPGTTTTAPPCLTNFGFCTDDEQCCSGCCVGSDVGAGSGVCQHISSCGATTCNGTPCPRNEICGTGPGGDAECVCPPPFNEVTGNCIQCANSGDCFDFGYSPSCVECNGGICDVGPHVGDICFFLGGQQGYCVGSSGRCEECVDQGGSCTDSAQCCGEMLCNGSTCVAQLACSPACGPGLVCCNGTCLECCGKFESQCPDSICFQGTCFDGCVIEGVAYLNGTKNPANECQQCNTAISRTRWENLSQTFCTAGCSLALCVSGLCGLVIGGGGCVNTQCATATCGPTGCVYTPRNEGQDCVPTSITSACQSASSGTCTGVQCVPDAINVGEPCFTLDRCIVNATCRADGVCDGFAKVCTGGPCALNPRCNSLTGECESDLPPDGAECVFFTQTCPCGQECECQQFNTAGTCLFAQCRY